MLSNTTDTVETTNTVEESNPIVSRIILLFSNIYFA